MTDDGRWGDYWVYEDRLIYVHKRHVAIPLDATPDGDVRRFDRTKMFIAAMTYDEMRPGCYEPKARIDDLALAGVDGSLAFPTFPRFCGQTFMEGSDLELGLECVRAYNDWMIEDWCGDSDGRLIPLCLIPLWDVDLAVAEVARNAARGARAICFSEIPTHLGLPSIHTGYWDPLFATCEETRTRCACTSDRRRRCRRRRRTRRLRPTSCCRATTRWRRSPTSCSPGCSCAFPELKLAYSEGQIGWIPYALERADNIWEYHTNWTGAKETIPEPPSTYYHGRIFGCFTE